MQRLIDLAGKAANRPSAGGEIDVEAHHARAREIAGRAIVLLRNEDELLPLREADSLAVIGEFARSPRYQGAGSSQINPTRVDDALSALRARAGGALRARAGGEVTFAPGFTLDGSGDEEALRAEAVQAAAGADTAVLFLGLDSEEESEGYDREHIDLPAAQLALVDAVLEANPRTVVVLSHGGVVALPFAQSVPAILESWLLGQAGGPATADVLYGDVTPVGKLTETIPLRLEDSPSHGTFPGELGHVRYGEGVLVGYRGFDARGLEVAFPFGHGLSYTSFEYGEPAVEAAPDGALTVTVPVTNTGAVAGREVVQVYVGLADSIVQRAPRELKGFALLDLAPGATGEPRIEIPAEDLAYWDVRVDRWVLEGGTYTVEVGASSRDLRGRVEIALEGEEVGLPLSLDSTIDEVLADPVVGPKLREAMDDSFDDSFLRMMGSIPVGRLEGVPLPHDEMVRLLAQ